MCLHPQILKMLQSRKSEMGVLLLIKVTCDPPRGLGPASGTANRVFRRLELLVSPPSPGRGQWLQLASPANALVSHDHVMKPP